MNLSRIAIARPVFAIMLLAFFVVVGLVARSKLNIDIFPDISVPIVTIMTPYYGAAPDEIETLVTKKIEDAISSISGIDEISSTSYESYSIIVIWFVLEKDIADAAQEVREKVALVANELPEEAEDPKVSRIDLNAMPILHYGVTSKSMTEVELRDWVDKNVKTELERVDGVSQVMITGGAEREIRVDLDKAKMEGLGISPDSVRMAMRLTNFDYPAGNVIEGGQDISLKVKSQFNHINDIRDTLIPYAGGFVRLDEIADAYDGAKEQESIVRVNGSSAIAIAISKQSGTNTVAVADAIVEKVESLRKSIPPGVSIDLIFDDSTFIRSSINDIFLTIAIAALMATFVVLLFIGSGKSTLAIALAIPISLVTTFALFMWADFTINFMSLMALAVAVGLVVDDAIVVTENIYRHLEMGKKPLQAALEGATEVTGAVVASMLAIVAVFLPIAFMEGIIGRFFREFGLGVAFAILISNVVALVMIPVILGYLYHRDMTYEQLKSRRFALAKWFDKKYKPIEDAFVRSISWVLTYKQTYFKIGRFGFGPTGRSVVIIAASLAFLFSIGLATKLNMGFVPRMDVGRVTISVELPPDVGLDETNRVVKLIEDRIGHSEDMIAVYAEAGTSKGGAVEKNKGLIRIRFAPKDERDFTTFQVAADLQKELADIPGATIQVKAISGDEQRGSDFRVQVVNPDRESLMSAGNLLFAKLGEIEGAADVDLSVKRGKVEVAFNPDFQRVADHGLTPVGIAQQLSGYVEGFYLGPYRELGEEYDITMYMQPEKTDTVEKLRNIQIWSPGLSRFVSLSQLANPQIISGAVRRERFDRTRSVELSCNIAPDSPRGVGDIRQDFLAAVGETELPSGTEIKFTGEAKWFDDMVVQLGTAMLLAIIFIYMVLASQFNSLVHPFNILLTVPLAIVGAIIAAFLTGTSFNIMSFMGVIMLTGLVTKNAILLIDFTNQRIRGGMNRLDALTSAAKTRLRPILMTALTTIVGLIPVAIGFGEGGGFRAPMGIAIIGGMIVATFLTLFVIPIAYTISDDLTKKILGHRIGVNSEKTADGEDGKEAGTEMLD
ncbi:efflux RND transporter permease subunit [bacterium]|nr:efflux RND transporter permease subunit [bacterium]